MKMYYSERNKMALPFIPSRPLRHGFCGGLFNLGLSLDRPTGSISADKNPQPPRRVFKLAALYDDGWGHVLSHQPCGVC
ncbi:hypothetical protein IRJ41_018264 [Triplophysa rosa]|uniref:Uncharacterized protein n=1 Tax=Triplophysa rosa TaxID=992332 RepID=A0A9W7TQI3_TRIRA|nr:hypothetical protein IRJ41_018264 [Triplophysa rosa]